MTEYTEKPWWDSNRGEAHEASRVEPLRRSLLTLIARDISFSLDALVQGCDYPGGVRLESLVVEQDQEVGEEPGDDWLFTLEGPDFRVVLVAVGRLRGEGQPTDISILRHPALDDAAGEAAALKWLEAPPMPDARGYR